MAKLKVVSFLGATSVCARLMTTTGCRLVITGQAYTAIFTKLLRTAGDTQTFCAPTWKPNKKKTEEEPLQRAIVARQRASVIRVQVGYRQALLEEVHQATRPCQTIRAALDWVNVHAGPFRIRRTEAGKL